MSDFLALGLPRAVGPAALRSFGGEQRVYLARGRHSRPRPRTGDGERRGRDRAAQRRRQVGAGGKARGEHAGEGVTSARGVARRHQVPGEALGPGAVGEHGTRAAERGDHRPSGSQRKRRRGHGHVAMVSRGLGAGRE